MLITLTNDSDDNVYVSSLFVSIAAGESVTYSRTQDQYDADLGVRALVDAATLSVDFEAEDADVGSGEIGPGAVGATELGALAVTAGKLAAAVAVKIPSTPTLAVGVEGAGAANAIDVTITLKDIAGTTLAAKAMATVWLSDTAGAAPTASAPTGGTSVQTGTLIKAHTAGIMLDVLSSAAGLIVVRLTDSGTATFYVNVAIGDVIASSAAVTFA